MATFYVHTAEIHACIYRVEAETAEEARESFEDGDWMGTDYADDCSSCEVTAVVEGDPS